MNKLHINVKFTNKYTFYYCQSMKSAFIIIKYLDNMFRDSSIYYIVCTIL